MRMDIADQPLHKAVTSVFLSYAEHAEPDSSLIHNTRAAQQPTSAFLLVSFSSNLSTHSPGGKYTANISLHAR